jgi:hypothetical protein
MTVQGKRPLCGVRVLGDGEDPEVPPCVQGPHLPRSGLQVVLDVPLSAPDRARSPHECVCALRPCIRPLTTSVVQSNSVQCARVRCPVRAQTAFACTRRRTRPRACLSPGTGATGRCTRSRSRASASSSSRRSPRGRPRRPAFCRNQPNPAYRVAGSPAFPPYGGRSRG